MDRCSNYGCAMRHDSVNKNAAKSYVWLHHGVVSIHPAAKGLNFRYRFCHEEYPRQVSYSCLDAQCVISSYSRTKAVTATLTTLNSATVLFPRGLGRVVSRSFSVDREVLSQRNIRGRSLQGPRLAATADLRKQHLVLGFCLFIGGSSICYYSS
jgi:hypothetical protein